MRQTMKTTKMIEITKTVYDICKEYPEVIEVMRELGFENITQPGMLNTAGRFMTIPKGAAMKKISMEKTREVFLSHGLEIKE